MWKVLKTARVKQQLVVPRNASFVFGVCLFYEFGWLTLEAFFALEAAKVDSLAFISYFEFSRVFVQNHAANGVSIHILWS